MFCSQCGTALDASYRFCTNCGTRTRSVVESTLVASDYDTRTARRVSANYFDPTKLTRWLLFLLHASVIINAIALLSGVLQYQLLSDFRLGVYASQKLAVAAGEANDRRQYIVGLLQTGISFLTIILFAKWIYKANFNVRQLGARNLTFTPGWAIGWYFIPVFNLWRPYQAMKEIWMASKNPADWTSQKAGGVLPCWWVFFLFDASSNRFSFRASLRASGINELLHATILQITTDAVSIASILISTILVKQIFEMQIAKVKATRTANFRQDAVSDRDAKPSMKEEYQTPKATINYTVGTASPVGALILLMIFTVVILVSYR